MSFIEVLAVGIIVLSIVTFLVILKRRQTPAVQGVVGAGAPALAPPVDNPARQFNQEILTLLEAQGAALKRHEMLPFHDLDYKEPMKGQTLALYQQIEQDIQTVRTSWLRLMDVQDQIDSIAKPDEQVSQEQFRDIAKLLETADAGAVRTQLEQGLALLDGMEQAHEEVAPLETEIKAHLATLTEHVEYLRSVGLQRIPFGEELPQVQDFVEVSLAGVVSDPIGAAETLAEAQTKLGHVSGPIAALYDSHVLLGQCQNRLAEFTSEVERLRGEGIPMQEAIAKPDGLLVEATNELDVYNRSFVNGDVDTAVRSINLVKDALDEAGRRINGSVEGKEFVAAELPVRRREIDRLEREKNNADNTLAELANAYARDSWIEISALVDRGTESLGSMHADLDEAERLNTEKQYIGAANLVESVLEAQAEVKAYFEAPCACQVELQHLAQTSAEHMAAADLQIKSLRGFQEQHSRSLPEFFGKLLGESQDAVNQSRSDAQAATPHWPRIGKQLDEVRGSLQALDDEAATITQTLTELGSRARELNEIATEVGTFLAAHEQDRPRANQLHASASKALDAYLKDLGSSRKDVATLKRELEHLQMEIEESRNTAESDVQLDHHAQSAIDQASKVLQEVRAFNDQGVVPRTSSAEASLRGAREARQRQDYERVPELALQAEQAANQAYEQAVEEARRRGEESRRRRQDNIKQVVSVGAMVGAQILGEVIRSQTRGSHRPYHHRRKTFF